MARPLFLQDHERLNLLLLFGSCPHCGGQQLDGRQHTNARFASPITRRRVVLRCNDCGLRWSMTHHQMMKVCESGMGKIAKNEKNRPVAEFPHEVAVINAYGNMFESLEAFALPETRGRKPKPRPQLTAAERTEAVIEQVDRLHELRVRDVKRKLSGN
jgi:hypothetical protein